MLVVGGFLILVGVLGLIPPLHENWPADEPLPSIRNGRGYLFGVFPNNLLLSLVHLVIGVWGVLAAKYRRSTVDFLHVAIAIFGVLALLGLIPWTHLPARIIPTFGYTAVFHAGVALVLAGVEVFHRRTGMHREPPKRARNGVFPGLARSHAFLSAFPTAFLVAAVGSDLAHWWTTLDWYVDYADFWSTASVWLIGIGLASGLLAALTGVTARRGTAGLSHALGSAALLVLAAINLLLRYGDHEARVIPWGIVLSVMTAAVAIIWGWRAGRNLAAR